MTPTPAFRSSVSFAVLSACAALINLQSVSTTAAAVAGLGVHGRADMNPGGMHLAHSTELGNDVKETERRGLREKRYYVAAAPAAVAVPRVVGVVGVPRYVTPVGVAPVAFVQRPYAYQGYQGYQGYPRYGAVGVGRGVYTGSAYGGAVARHGTYRGRRR